MQDSSTPEAEQQFEKDVETADTLDTTVTKFKDTEGTGKVLLVLN
jgi:hypothetical protein